MPFFTELARLSGANEEEISEAITAASIVARDVTYMAGIDYDADQFKRELRAIVEHTRRQQPQQPAA